MFSKQTKQISLSQKIKTIGLLLCLCFVIVGTCPIQKLILQISFVELEASKQSKTSRTETNVSCTYNEQVFEVPVVQFIGVKLAHIPFTTLFNNLGALRGGYSITETSVLSKNKEPIYSSVSIYLKNQVFII